MNLAEFLRELTEDRIKKIIYETPVAERVFLYESNKFEGEESAEALLDTMISWDYAKVNRFDNKTPKYVGDTHFLLMRNINPKIAGNYRTNRLIVGCKDDTLPPEKIESAMTEWCEGFNALKSSSEEIRDEHVRFLKIHPFADGNGRTARILMNVQRMNSGYGLMIVKRGKPPKLEDDYCKWFD